MYEELMQAIVAHGAAHAGIARVADIEFDRSFRAFCEQNSCGMYGHCWQCPPDCGDIDTLIAKSKSYDTAIVYQIIFPLEDSYDLAGMLEAGKEMNRLNTEVRALAENSGMKNALFLGAGSCQLCKRCAKLDNMPCRFPDRAIPSLEAHGVNVSTLASLAGMKYINGVNTVTYFGAIFCKEIQ